eukprot:RCo017619
MRFALTATTAGGRSSSRTHEFSPSFLFPHFLTSFLPQSPVPPPPFSLPDLLCVLVLARPSLSFSFLFSVSVCFGFSVLCPALVIPFEGSAPFKLFTFFIEFLGCSVSLPCDGAKQRLNEARNTD